MIIITITKTNQILIMISIKINKHIANLSRLVIEWKQKRYKVIFIDITL